MVRVELTEGAFLKCPVCGLECKRYDTQPERRWRHLDSCGFATYLVASTPRIECEADGVRVVGLPWSEPHSRFTLDFERFAILVVRMTKSQVRSARILNLSPDQVHDIMGRAVARGLARRNEAQTIENLGIDEKSFQTNKRFATVLSDMDGGRVLDVCRDRSSEVVSELLRKTMTASQLRQVKSVTMDMWDGFIKSAREVLPEADIVFDRFHIARYLNEAVDKTRIAENKRLVRQGNRSLTGSKFFWTSRLQSVHPRLMERYGHLLQASLETAKAWALKEMFRGFFDQTQPAQAKAFFDQWEADVLESGNAPLKRVAKMLRRYFYGLLAYITHRTTNSRAEGTNAGIQEIKFIARGFRRFQGFRTAILFFLGKLDLYPQKCL